MSHTVWGAFLHVLKNPMVIVSLIIRNKCVFYISSGRSPPQPSEPRGSDSQPTSGIGLMQPSCHSPSIKNFLLSKDSKK